MGCLSHSHTATTTAQKQGKVHRAVLDSIHKETSSGIRLVQRRPQLAVCDQPPRIRGRLGLKDIDELVGDGGLLLARLCAQGARQAPERWS